MGPAVTIEGPRRVPAATSSRQATCTGEPNMLRMVVTPLARSSVSSDSNQECTCMSTRPGMSQRPWPSMTVLPAGTASSPAGPSAVMRPSATSTVWSGSEPARSMGTTVEPTIASGGAGGSAASCARAATAARSSVSSRAARHGSRRADDARLRKPDMECSALEARSITLRPRGARGQGGRPARAAGSARGAVSQSREPEPAQHADGPPAEVDLPQAAPEARVVRLLVVVAVPVLALQQEEGREPPHVAAAAAALGRLAEVADAVHRALAVQREQQAHGTQPQPRDRAEGKAAEEGQHEHGHLHPAPDAVARA